ncbi:MAG TPA: glycoside hydrolase family 16 protein [Polyangia bacterium]|nr:glycoside hydrolase family 16 protein [Polyangia bacterium]
MLGATRVALVSALGVLACNQADLPGDGTGTSAALTQTAITLQTLLVPRFVGAANNGGGAVTATAIDAQAWETFALVDINGGSLDSGDRVFIRAGNGQYLQAANGGGSTLSAGGNDTQAWETFTLIKQSGGGSIKTGDVVGLQTVSGGWVSAENGGGGTVFAYGGALGAWESFVIGIGAPAPPSAPPGWRLVWSDEFDGGGIDFSKWGFDIQRPGWVNNELQNYTGRPENARVENGHLVLEARRDFFQGAEYSSARLNTVGHASFTYGRFEASIQLPGGWGTWPAFWMLPDDFSRGWPACGEIDVMEEVGFDPDTIHGSTHSQTYNFMRPQQRTSTIPVGGVTTGFHVYAVEWSPGGVDFFVDGREYLFSPNDNTGDDAWPFHKNFHLILNLAVGGDWGGSQGVDPNIWPRQMLVDYVRVYQR